MSSEQSQDERISRLEKQYDELTKQINSIPLLDQRMKDFIDRMDRYLARHDKEHEDLRNTDEILKKYLFVAVGVVGALSFIAPYVWQLLLRS